MRGRIVLFVVLAVVMALAGVYVGWSTSSPKAAADAPAIHPRSVGSAQEAGSARSRSPGTAAPKGATDKGVTDKGATESGDKPAPPPSSQPQHATGPVRFGKVTTAGRPNDDTTIANDRRALTQGVSEFEVTTSPGSAEPSATKSFSMTLPLTDGAEGETLRVSAAGVTLLEAGVTSRMTLRGGGRTEVWSFPGGTDAEPVAILELPATPGITYQLSAVIEIHRDAAGEGSGYLNIVTIEIGIS
jgi:hypothetical protein